MKLTDALLQQQKQLGCERMKSSRWAIPDSGFGLQGGNIGALHRGARGGESNTIKRRWNWNIVPYLSETTLLRARAH